MSDPYCRLGIRLQSRIWYALIAANAATAVAALSAVNTQRAVMLPETLEVASYVAYAALLLGLGFTLSSNTGTIFRLGLLFSASSMRRYGPLILAANMLAPALVLAGRSVGVGSLPGLVVWSLAAAAAALLFVVPLVEDRMIQRYDPPNAAEKLKQLGDRHGTQAMERVSLSWDLFNGKAPYSNPTNSQRGLVVAGLSAKPWLERHEVPWFSIFEDSWRDVLDEYVAYAKTVAEIPDYIYPGAVVGKWNTVMLVSAMAPEPVLEFFPKTRKLLEAVPNYPKLREAQISILGPGSRIKPHRDAGNFWHTCQLALQIPDEARCGIRVGGITRHWSVGQTLFFNTSYEHEAWNDTDDLRIVLIIDYLHPELTEPESEFITDMLGQGFLA